MIILFLLLTLYLFTTVIKKYSQLHKLMLCIMTILSILGMISYEVYVEYYVGWPYGVPYDDDTGWIFRASRALADGVSIRELYSYVLSIEYDSDNRVLSIANLGQYIYCIFTSALLYFPTLFSVRVNLYLQYIIQILLILSAIISLVEVLDDEMCQSEKRKKALFLVLVSILFFCPLVQFNAYKLLRETLFFFFVIYTIVFSFRDKYYSALACFCMSVLMRPLILIMLLPILVYRMINLKMAHYLSIAFSIVLIFSSQIVNLIARYVGWTYDLDNISLYEMVHLFFFPNIFNQFELIQEVFTYPSWVTVLYFTQSVWNIVFLSLFILGIILMNRSNNSYYIWLLALINTLMVYTIPYDVENFTVRYKISFLIPTVYFIYGFILKYNFRIKRKHK